jgi:uncharacterized Zn finger protein
MEPVDGNAIAGPLFEHFGSEMTAVAGSCAHCGKRSQIAELVVYTKAPGRVVRCPNCGNIVLVLVQIRGTLRVDVTAFRMAQAQT